MAYEALRYYNSRELNFRFVSNIDGTDFAEATPDPNPVETLFFCVFQNLHDIRQIRFSLSS